MYIYLALVWDEYFESGSFDEELKSENERKLHKRLCSRHFAVTKQI